MLPNSFHKISIPIMILTVVLLGGIFTPYNLEQKFLLTSSFSVPATAHAQSELVEEKFALAEKLGVNPDEVGTLESFALFGFQTIDSFFSWVVGFFGVFVMAIFGLFLTLAGILLNEAVRVTVLEMANFIGPIETIEQTWAVLRDLANIILIFTFLAIGIGTILQIEGYGIRKLLPRLIIVALLINFSLFFTQVIIDTSNLLAATIYNQIETEGASIADTIQKELGLLSTFKFDSLLSSLDISGGVTETVNSSRTLAIAFAAIGGSIFFLTATFVFLAAALLLIIRFAVLVFLMVLSPIAFAFMALPYTQKYARQWWEALFSQAFFAPILFLFLWITIEIISSPLGPADGADKNFAALLATGNSSAIGVLLSYSIIIAFLVFSLVAAKKLGALGSITVVSWGQGLRKWGQATSWRATKGAVRPLRQYVHGKVAGAAERIEKAPQLQGFMDKFPGAPIVGRATRRGLQRTRASYTADVFGRQQELETLRGGELDRRLQSASDHDFIALVLEKQKRGDLDEISPEQVIRARKLMKAAGMGTLTIDKARPDAGATREDKRSLMMKVNEKDVGALWHKERIVSRINDDNTVKWAEPEEDMEKSMKRATGHQTETLEAMYELLDGGALRVMFNRGGQNVSELLGYATDRLGLEANDPKQLHKMAAELREINHMRETGKTLEGTETKTSKAHQAEALASPKIVERTESAIQYLESVAARRAVGIDKPSAGESGQQRVDPQNFKTKEEQNLAKGLQDTVDKWQQDRGDNTTQSGS